MSCTGENLIAASATVLRNAPGRVELAVSRKSACSACAEKNQCGSKQDHTRAQRIWLASATPLIVGQQVSVAMPENQLLRGALLMYGLPLLGFVLGLLAGAGYGDKAAITCAGVGLAIGFAGVHLLVRRWILPLQLMDIKA